MGKQKGKGEMNLLTNDEFFDKISERCNYIDVELTRQVYYEIIRLTTQELRHNGAIRFPDFGDFYIKLYKERTIKDVRTRQPILVPSKRSVKFIPDYKVKRYFQSLS